MIFLYTCISCVRGCHNIGSSLFHQKTGLIIFKNIMFSLTFRLFLNIMNVLPVSIYRILSLGRQKYLAPGFNFFLQLRPKSNSSGSNNPFKGQRALLLSKTSRYDYEKLMKPNMNESELKKYVSFMFIIILLSILFVCIVNHFLTFSQFELHVWIQSIIHLYNFDFFIQNCFFYFAFLHKIS